MVVRRRLWNARRSPEYAEADSPAARFDAVYRHSSMSSNRSMTLPAFGNLVQSAPDKRLHAFEIEPYITIPDVKQALVSSADPHGRTTIDGTPYELNWSRIDESALYRAADGRSHTPFEVLRLLYVPPDKIVYWPTGYFVFKDKRTEDLIYFCVEGTGRDDLSLRMASDPEQEYLLGEMAAIERLDDEQASA